MFVKDMLDAHVDKFKHPQVQQACCQKTVQISCLRTCRRPGPSFCRPALAGAAAQGHAEVLRYMLGVGQLLGAVVRAEEGVITDVCNCDFFWVATATLAAAFCWGLCLDCQAMGASKVAGRVSAPTGRFRSSGHCGTIT